MENATSRGTNRLKTCVRGIRIEITDGVCVHCETENRAEMRKRTRFTAIIKILSDRAMLRHPPCIVMILISADSQSF